MRTPFGFCRPLYLALSLQLAPAVLAGSFAPAGAPAVPRFLHAATALEDGRVLITGGACRTPDTCRGEAEIYDPVANTFERTGTMLRARQAHTATRLPDGRVLIVGGDNGRDDIDGVEIYDPATGEFTAAGTFTARGHYALILAGGGVLIASGTGRNAIYDPATGEFKTVVVGAPRSAGVRMADGRIFTIGGRLNGSHSYSLQTWDFSVIYSADAGKSIRGFGHPPHEGYSGATLTALRDGAVLLAGGSELPFPHILLTALNNIYRFDAGVGAFEPKSGLVWAREGHTTTLLPDGRLLITGGYANLATNLPSAELYDAEAGASQPLPVMNAARTGHTATLLRDGRVLIVGGDRAELYIPDTPAQVPELYAAPAGSTQGAILHGNTGRLVTESDPASAGDAIEIYATGLAGGAILPQVTIGGKTAEVLYFGSAPGYESLNQINVRVPEGIEPGEATVRVFDLDRPTNAVTIGVR